MKRPHNQGISLVEALIASSIIIIVIGAVIAAYSLYISQHRITTSSVKGSMLVEEGLEAVRTIRDRGWDTSFGTLSEGTEYYLDFDEGPAIWKATTTPQLIDDLYERFFVIEDVYRDGDDDIASSGSIDPDTKKVTVTVTWQTKNGTSTKEMSAYFANLFDL